MGHNQQIDFMLESDNDLKHDTEESLRTRIGALFEGATFHSMHVVHAM